MFASDRCVTIFLFANDAFGAKNAASHTKPRARYYATQRIDRLILATSRQANGFEVSRENCSKSRKVRYQSLAAMRPCFWRQIRQRATLSLSAVTQSRDRRGIFFEYLVFNLTTFLCTANPDRTVQRRSHATPTEAWLEQVRSHSIRRVCTLRTLAIVGHFGLALSASKFEQF